VVDSYNLLTFTLKKCILFVGYTLKSSKEWGSEMTKDGEDGKRKPFFVLKSFQCSSKTARNLQKKLIKSDCSISDAGDELLFKFSQEEILRELQETTSLSLVQITSRDLGLKGMYTYTELCDAAKERGYQECNPILCGPVLRMQYKKQPFFETLFVAMKPVGELESVFSVANTTYLGRHLDAVRTQGVFFTRKTKWIFTTSA